MTTNFDQIKSYSISKKGLELDFNRSHIIKYFTSSFLKNLSLENPKNVILNIPYLNTSRKWILFDVLLNHMEQSFKKSSIRFQEGDCLRITGTQRKIICEFMGYENEGTDEERLIIKFENSLTNSVLSGHWAFEKVKPQRLSSFKSFSVNEKLFALDKIIDKSSNNNFALFDTSFLYIGGINSTRRFISKNMVFENPIQKTISWSKTNENGTIKKLHGNETSHFNCVVAPSISSGLTTIEVNEKQNFNAIIIDSLDICKNYLAEMFELADLGIPIYIFSNQLDQEFYDIFCTNLNFELWHWGMEPVKSLLKSASHDESIPYELVNLKRACDNFANKEIHIDTIQDKHVERIGKFSVEMNKLISEIPISNQVYSELRKLSLRLSRIASIKCLNVDTYEQHVKDIKNLIERKSYQIPESDEEIFSKMLSLFDEFFEENLEEYILEKEDKLFELIRAYRNENLCIISSVNLGNTKLNKIVRHNCVKEVKVYQSSSEIKVHDNYTTAIVTGWAIGKRLDQILLSNKFKKIIFLVYPYQLNWLKNKIASKNNFYDKNSSNDALNNFHDELDDLLPLMSQHQVLPMPEILLPDTIEDIPMEDMDIDEFEIQIKERRRRAFQSSDEEGVVRFETAKLVDFYDGYAGVFSDGHRFLNVSGMMDADDDATIVETKTDDLKRGDYVLHFETEKGSVTTLTKERMESDDRKDVYILSKIWVSSLIMLYQRYSFNTDAMYKALKEEGLSVGIAQLRNWLSGATIAPKDDNNFIVIGEILGGDEGKALVDNAEKILGACDVVKQYRLQIAKMIRTAAYDAISKLDLTHYGESEQNIINLDVEEYGEATIYRIEDIDSDYTDYPHTIVNKIREEEN